MKKQDNEQLCALAHKGDTEARDLLLKNNLGFIRKTANEIFLKSNLVESDLSIEIGDLEQEGGIALLKAIPSYDKSGRRQVSDLCRSIHPQRHDRPDTRCFLSI